MRVIFIKNCIYSKGTLPQDSNLFYETDFLPDSIFSSEVIYKLKKYVQLEHDISIDNIFATNIRSVHWKTTATSVVTVDQSEPSTN